ncbi:oxygenase MpaB family protein [[Mycobacterium] burgundiense]|uniref:Oxygenase MpaB family protein n=1 Tax=[Mycobacterium] burgundiense TaxID=3064286 RepID=A0ABM9LXG5_9MYCO|nr:oxygenase MpaB family protein [Mycolicibacterium sp. MU0053]CAJ1506395.1 oxygenase MpaB family protein [Mycolicibacterium sp. MU0053]
MSTFRAWFSELTAAPEPTPAEDYGFFGPDSVTWRVWSYPTSLTIGFQRAVVVEELDPALVAAVDQTHEIYRRPRTRYDRTLRYFAMVAFDDSRSTTKAADVLVKIHSKAIGTDPVTGRRYDANDPDSQLWIHLTAWHSILKAYEKYGPGPLSEDDERRYWADCAVAAELQTCDPADVPRTREGVQDYFDRMRPELIGSDIAKRAMKHLLRAEVMLPEMPRVLRPATWVATAVLRRGTLATMPRWMRELAGLSTSRVLDALAVPPLRVAFAAVALSTRLQLILLQLLSPTTVPVAARVLRSVPAINPVTTTPRVAQARFGYDNPRAAHQGLRARQQQRVFDAGAAPSDEGIVESQPILGTVG